MFRPPARVPLPVRGALLAAFLVSLCGAATTGGAGASPVAGPLPVGPAADGEPTPGTGLLWTDPDSPAARQAAEWRRAGRTADAGLMDRIALRPQAQWVSGPHPGPEVRERTTAAARAGRIPVLVSYYVPNRDCGQYSTGGAPDAAQYRAWADEFAEAIGDRAAYVIVEPDAVAQVVAGCTHVAANERYALLAHAVDRFARQPHARVYLDAGNPGWITETWRLVDALRASGAAKADGVAVNTANFQTDEASSTYGERLSQELGGVHYVVDTSRNGNGPAMGADSWCNPPGRALGMAPTTVTGRPRLDAYLWIKRPGESDGTCRGGPEAGRWWPSYALELARNAAG